MKANIYYRLTKLISATLMLTLAGCLGSGGGTTSTPSNPPSSASIAQLSVVDANKVPVGNGTVSITSATGTAVSSGATSNAGVLGVNLPSGSYTMSVTKGAATSTTQIAISSTNANTNATVLIPAVQNATGSMTDISTTAVVASIVGKITDATGPIAGATVSLSSATAATVASAVTDVAGNYYLAINVSNTLADANGIFVGNLNVSKTGYGTFVTTGLQVSPGTNVVGLNYKLTQAAASTALYSENFETAAAAGACGQWTSANSEPTAGWHPHGAGLGITNAAYTQGLVSLAPDDTSLGKVPDPIGGTTACWYGAANMGANFDEQGNFMGITGWNTVGSLNGGSSSANHGALISPVINLTAVPAGTAISLSFNTFWEIESVNPNNLGYDIMEVDYSVDNGVTWIALARLNPLSDPSTAGVIRDPIPFSNTGYNSAPKWVAQEPIPLVDPTTGLSLAGNNIKLRFAFNTKDGLYNGFRGWMIDDVAINQQIGTYPIMAPGAMTTFMAQNKVRSLVK